MPLAMTMVPLMFAANEPRIALLLCIEVVAFMAAWVHLVAQGRVRSLFKADVLLSLAITGMRCACQTRTCTSW